MLFLNNLHPEKKIKTIIGSGLLAKAFETVEFATSSVCIYAAGVSNSGSSNIMEFERERFRLTEALIDNSKANCFVYFSTCSIEEPIASYTAYIKHKIAMETLVANHPAFLIVRLPQVAGNTTNPYTLLNYLHKRISLDEKIILWKNAERNIIDISDIVPIVKHLINNFHFRQIKVNVANEINYPITQVIEAMEKVIGKLAYTEVIEKGSAYAIDTSLIKHIIVKLNITFDNKYLTKVIKKYYKQGSK